MLSMVNGTTVEGRGLFLSRRGAEELPQQSPQLDESIGTVRASKCDCRRASGCYDDDVVVPRSTGQATVRR